MKRTIFILLITMAGSFAAFVEAYWGLLLYSWYSFASPLELTYGMLAGTRLSLLVGGLLVATTLYQYKTLCRRHALTYLMYALMLAAFSSLAAQMQFGFSTITRHLELLSKLIVIAGLAPVLLTSLPRIRGYILVIAVSGGLLGFYYGVFGLFAGSKQIFGPGRIGDNNGYAVFLAALLPFIFFSGRHLQWQIVSRFRGLITAALVAGNCLALILTYSRGGFLAGATVLVLLLCKLRSAVSRMLGWGIILPTLLFAGWTVFSVNPDLIELPQGTVEEGGVVQEILQGYVSRLRTLRYEIDKESSAGGRLHFWRVAGVMIKDNPIFGVGLHQFSAQYSKYDFSDGEYGDSRAVHNTLLLIFSELGLVGFSLFSGIIFLMLYALYVAKDRVKGVQDTAITEEVSSYVAMVRISLCGFLIGGLFVNVPYQEIFWALVSISIALDHYTRKLVAVVDVDVR